MSEYGREAPISEPTAAVATRRDPFDCSRGAQTPRRVKDRLGWLGGRSAETYALDALLLDAMTCALAI